jgi:hypothetical protein
MMKKSWMVSSNQQPAASHLQMGGRHVINKHTGHGKLADPGV